MISRQNVIFGQFDQLFVVFIAFVINLVYTLFNQCYSDLVFKKQKGQVINEKLGSFWTNLSAYDQKLWYTKEVYQRSALKLKSLTDQNLE